MWQGPPDDTVPDRLRSDKQVQRTHLASHVALPQCLEAEPQAVACPRWARQRSRHARQSSRAEPSHLLDSQRGAHGPVSGCGLLISSVRLLARRAPAALAPAPATTSVPSSPATPGRSILARASDPSATSVSAPCRTPAPHAGPKRFACSAAEHDLVVQVQAQGLKMRRR